MIHENLQILGPIMTLNNKNEDGLEIAWNFTGMIKQQSFEVYHLFVLFNGQYEEVTNFIQLYYSDLKYGELIGIFEHVQQKNKNRKIKWNEKTAFGMDENFLLQRHIDQNMNSEMIPNLFDVVSKLNGLVFINILHGKTNKDLQIEQKSALQEIRIKFLESRKFSSQLDRAVLNFIQQGTYTNKLNCLEGINYLFYSKETDSQSQKDDFKFKGKSFFQSETTLGSFEDLSKKIKKFLKLLVIKKLRARIYLQGNKHFFSHTNSQWIYCQNGEYLQKIYYGVPACGFKQIFMFIASENQQGQQLKLKIHLDCFFYDGGQMQAKREINFQIKKVNLSGRTLGNQKQKAKFIGFPGVSQMTINLSSSENYVWIFNPRDSKKLI